MTKSEQREVQRATIAAQSCKVYAASSLASLHRAATKKTQGEILAVIGELGLMPYLSIVNGCLVSKEVA